MRNVRHRREEQGLTLVELLGAMTVALLVLAVLFSIHRSSVATEKAIESQSQLQRQVRNAEMFIANFIRDSVSVKSPDGSHLLTAVQGSGTQMTVDLTNQGLQVAVTNKTAPYIFDAISGFTVSPSPSSSGPSSSPVLVQITIQAQTQDGKQRYSDTILVAPRLSTAQVSIAGGNGP